MTVLSTVVLRLHDSTQASVLYYCHTASLLSYLTTVVLRLQLDHHLQRRAKVCGPSSSWTAARCNLLAAHNHDLDDGSSSELFLNLNLRLGHSMARTPPPPPHQHPHSVEQIHRQPEPVSEPHSSRHFGIKSESQGPTRQGSLISRDCIRCDCAIVQPCTSFIVKHQERLH